MPNKLFSFSLLFLLSILLPIKARPADGSMHAGFSMNQQATELVAALKELPPNVQGQLALDFLTSFDKTPAELNEEMSSLLAPYPGPQSLMNNMMSQAKEQNTAKFQTYVDSLTNQTLKAAAQNLLNTMSNDNTKISEMCNEFMNYINSISAEDKTKLFVSMPESDQFVASMKAGNEAEAASNGGSSTNWCQKMQDYMENMAEIVKAKMANASMTPK